MIRITRGNEPQGLQRSARDRLKAAAETFNQHVGLSRALLEMLSGGYNAHATKLALYQAQHQKCAWCERQTPFSSSPVEHYRPKDGARRDLRGKNPRVDKGYYWWLAWSWSNLLFSCAQCNDQGHKANYFPLHPRSRRATAPTAPLSIPPPSPIADVSKERPLLIDPAGPGDPLDHIQWVPLNTNLNRRDWIWTPEGLTDEGRATIKILKLGELADWVQGHVRTRLLPSIEEVESHLAAGRGAAAHQRWGHLLADSFAPSSEWSAFTWHALNHLVPASYRTLHQLAPPPRPGARVTNP